MLNRQWVMDEKRKQKAKETQETYTPSTSAAQNVTNVTNDAGTYATQGVFTAPRTGGYVYNPAPVQHSGYNPLHNQGPFTAPVQDSGYNPLHNQGPFTAPKNTRKESADTQDESYHRKRRRVAAPFAAPKKRGLNTRDRRG
jgi:hypothetical protein